jgi:hypothetical protein
MAKIGDIYPSKFLKADDFKGQQNVTLTIKATPLEEPFGEQKTVLYFHETEKAFTLNPTNARIVVQLLEDDETDNWIGAKITLTPAMRNIAGQLKKVIDVTAAYFPQGQQQQGGAFPPPPAAKTVAEGDIPF